MKLKYLQHLLHILLQIYKHHLYFMEIGNPGIDYKQFMHRILISNTSAKLNTTDFKNILQST